jgi:S-adenosylmethionine synthetase
MFKTAECVTPMHPDKICDRISDAILDACLEQDPMSRVAIETMGGHNLITITGELTTNAYVDIPSIVRRIVGDKYGIQTNIVKQSSDISRGVDNGGAGDQGIMVGYACRDNKDLIPQELYLARSLCKFIYEKYPADGKTQVTINEDGELQTVVVSFCGVKQWDLIEAVKDWVSRVANEIAYIGKEFQLFVNPAGDWNQGGFDADTGLTGRKIAIDNYGPQIPIGGGAFSGKDATKVDRSGAYAARFFAVSILRKEKSDNNSEAVSVQTAIAYSIGVADPVMVSAKIEFADGTRKEINFDDMKEHLRPATIIERLGLREPKFEKTAEWGHFGNGNIWDNEQ